MSILSEIFISEPLLKSRKLISKLSVSKDLTKYLKTNELFIEYDTDILADTSILNIPLIATVLPLAWLTGSDIHVDILDRRFKESMDKLKLSFKQMFPMIPFTTNIHTEELVDNRIGAGGAEKTGLLFSGGVDSTYTLLKNLHKKPKLIMMWGVDNFPYPEHSPHWEMGIKTYTRFSSKKDLDFHLIKTNISQILDDTRIEHSFHDELYDGRLRFALQHSLILLPTAAPLSVGRFKHFLIAASFLPGINFSLYPRAALPSLDEMIVWADLTVEHHGFIDRTEKLMGAIVDYLKNDDLTFRVCVRSELVDGNLNDSMCEKCLRTLVLLVLASIDPNTCGFTIDESTFSRIRSYWENKKSITPNFSWRKIQEMIPSDIKYDLYGSKDFFEWFRDYEFVITKKNWFYTDLYTRLPYRVARQLDKVYRKLNINVHESPYRRELNEANAHSN